MLRGLCLRYKCVCVRRREGSKEWVEISTSGRASAAGPRGHHPTLLVFVSHVDTESMLMETKHPINSHAIMTATLHVHTAGVLTLLLLARESRRNSRKTTWFPRHRKMTQLEKIHVLPSSSQDEALFRYSISREVPRSLLKSEKLLGTLDATPKVPRHTILTSKVRSNGCALLEQP